MGNSTIIFPSPTLPSGMSHLKAILYATLSVSTILATALVFAVLICPILQRNIRHLIIAFLVALGAGCLAGDAIFHLIPHAINPRISVQYLGIQVDPHGDALVLWRSLVIVCSIYVFYLFHLATHAIESGHSHSHINTPSLVSSDKQSPVSPTPDGFESLNDDHLKSSNSSSSKKSTLVIMILLGDVIHSLNDGMAIGGAFSKSASDGLSTSLAVLFHEVPHVVGDFAILVSSGLTMKRGLCFQAFSLSPMYAGLIIGVLLGTTLSLTDWIFAVTAGMFLFVAFAEMVPELLLSASTSVNNKTTVIILQNAGLITGFAIMGLLAAFEHRIKQALS